MTLPIEERKKLAKWAWHNGASSLFIRLNFHLSRKEA